MSKYYIIRQPEMTDLDEVTIVPVSEDSVGAYGSWRDAKKALRVYYINKAQSLRDVTEEEYFKNA